MALLILLAYILLAIILLGIVFVAGIGLGGHLMFKEVEKTIESDLKDKQWLELHSYTNESGEVEL